MKSLMLFAILLGLSVAAPSDAACGWRVRSLFRGGACGGVEARTTVRVRQRVLFRRGRVHASCAAPAAASCGGQASVSYSAPIQPVAACQCGAGCQCAGTQGGVCDCAAQNLAAFVTPQIHEANPSRVICVGGQCFISQ